MSYRAAVESVRDFVINHIPGFDAESCSVGDETIFEYIQSRSVGDRKAVLVSPEPFSADPVTEQMGATIRWTVGVNAFFGINSDDIITPMMGAIDFADEFLVGITRNPNLDDGVYSVKLSSGGPLMTYSRANFYYFLMPLTVVILDNIS
jgi:hypothetical protein